MPDSVVRQILPNGLTLLSEAMPHVRSVAIGVWVKSGSRHESEAQGGLAHFIEHMVFKGTRRRTAEAIAAEVDAMGGHMDAFTSKEYAAFHLKVLDSHLPQAVDILSDIVLHPAFAPEEMAREKQVIFEEMGMVEDTPDDLVMELFAAALWPDHPLGRPILGTRRSLRGFERRHLAGFFRRVYRPANMVISAAGHLEHAALARLVGEAFGALGQGRVVRDGGPPRAAAGVVTRSKRELEQVHLCLGGPAHPQAHPDRYVGYVLNTILGGSLSSRLFQNIREKRGLAYAISSGVASYSDTGSLSIYAGTRLDRVERVLSLTLDELRRLQDEPVPADELKRARDHLKGSLMLALENTGSRMSHLARQEIYFGRQFSLDELVAGIDAVEARDVERVARELLGRGLTLSLLGNLKGYRPRARALRL
jgi:predicted Zn-dependent peptidase